MKVSWRWRLGPRSPPKYAKEYAKASKTDKGRLLDEVVSVTGWSRDNARRRLVAGREDPPGQRPAGRPGGRAGRGGESYDSLRVLQRVWSASGGLCGKYLAVAMPVMLDALERHGELVDGAGRYSPAVRTELLGMSGATIDRYLAPTRGRDRLRGIPATKPSPLLRSSIAIRKAGDEVEREPGFFEGHTVAHCGPTPQGRVRPEREPDRRTHRAGVHPLGAQQRARSTSWAR